ncbi:MAG: sigma-70 family RNA polymerase sigma factor [Candidatus Omnitrophota bacterium]|jgi:RNA polymerase sigma factor (sigma-70 family)
MSYPELLKRLSPRLKGITHKLNGKFTFFNEDDLFQEALIRLWQEFERGRLFDKTDSYILQGCYFHLKNYIRKTYDKKNTLSLEELLLDDDTGEDRLSCLSSPAPFGYLHAHIVEEEMISACRDERENAIFRLSLQGFTVREIAAELGISHVLVVRLRKRMREKLLSLAAEN